MLSLLSLNFYLAAVLLCFSSNSITITITTVSGDATGNKVILNLNDGPGNPPDEQYCTKQANLQPPAPCGQCFGDCDSDNDCQSGMKCFPQPPLDRGGIAVPIAGCFVPGGVATAEYCTPYQFADPARKETFVGCYIEDERRANNPAFRLFGDYAGELAASKTFDDVRTECNKLCGIKNNDGSNPFEYFNIQRIYSTGSLNDLKWQCYCGTSAEASKLGNDPYLKVQDSECPDAVIATGGRADWRANVYRFESLTTETTDDDSESKVILPIILSIVGVVLLGSIIGYCFWRRRSKKKLGNNNLEEIKWQSSAAEEEMYNNYNNQWQQPSSAAEEEMYYYNGTKGKGKFNQQYSSDSNLIQSKGKGKNINESKNNEQYSKSNSDLTINIHDNFTEEELEKMLEEKKKQRSTNANEEEDNHDHIIRTSDQNQNEIRTSESSKALAPGITSDTSIDMVLANQSKSTININANNSTGTAIAKKTTRKKKKLIKSPKKTNSKGTMDFPSDATAVSPSSSKAKAMPKAKNKTKVGGLKKKKVIKKNQNLLPTTTTTSATTTSATTTSATNTVSEDKDQNEDQQDFTHLSIADKGTSGIISNSMQSFTTYDHLSMADKGTSGIISNSMQSSKSGMSNPTQLQQDKSGKQQQIKSGMIDKGLKSDKGVMKSNSIPNSMQSMPMSSFTLSSDKTHLPNKSGLKSLNMSNTNNKTNYGNGKKQVIPTLSTSSGQTELDRSGVSDSRGSFYVSDSSAYFIYSAPDTPNNKASTTKGEVNMNKIPSLEPDSSSTIPGSYNYNSISKGKNGKDKGTNLIPSLEPGSSQIGSSMYSKSYAPSSSFSSKGKSNYSSTVLLPSVLQTYPPDDHDTPGTLLSLEPGTVVNQIPSLEPGSDRDRPITMLSSQESGPGSEDLPSMLQTMVEESQGSGLSSKLQSGGGGGGGGISFLQLHGNDIKDKSIVSDNSVNSNSSNSNLDSVCENKSSPKGKGGGGKLLSAFQLNDGKSGVTSINSTSGMSDDAVSYNILPPNTLLSSGTSTTSAIMSLKSDVNNKPKASPHIPSLEPDSSGTGSYINNSNINNSNIITSSSCIDNSMDNIKSISRDRTMDTMKNNKMGSASDFESGISFELGSGSTIYSGKSNHKNNKSNSDNLNYDYMSSSFKFSNNGSKIGKNNSSNLPSSEPAKSLTLDSDKEYIHYYDSEMNSESQINSESSQVNKSASLLPSSFTLANDSQPNNYSIKDNYCLSPILTIAKAYPLVINCKQVVSSCKLLIFRLQIAKSSESFL